MRSWRTAPALAALALAGLATPAAARQAPAAGRPERRAPPPSPPPLQPLSLVLAQTFRCYGGVEAILAVGGLRLRGTLYDDVVAPGSRPRVERLLRPPDRYRAAVTLGGMERETLTLDAGRAFRDGVEVTGLARADLIRLEAARTFLPAALARGRLALVDRGQVRRGSRQLRLVELPLHAQASITAEIEAESGRIVRAVTRVAGRQTATSFQTFRTVNGLLFPFVEVIEADGGRRTLQVESVELVPPEAITVKRP